MMSSFELIVCSSTSRNYDATSDELRALTSNLSEIYQLIMYSLGATYESALQDVDTVANAISSRWDVWAFFPCSSLPRQLNPPITVNYFPVDALCVDSDYFDYVGLHRDLRFIYDSHFGQLGPVRLRIRLPHLDSLLVLLAGTRRLRLAAGSHSGLCPTFLPVELWRHIAKLVGVSFRCPFEEYLERLKACIDRSRWLYCDDVGYLN